MWKEKRMKIAENSGWTSKMYVNTIRVRERKGWWVGYGNILVVEWDIIWGKAIRKRFWCIR